MFFLYRRRRPIALVFVLVFSIQLLPIPTLAVASGPTLPEFSGYQVYSPSDLVDPFTGDFSYSIPLFDLPGPDGGYPFNLSYSAGAQVEDEASWVGLGWSLNVGAINRTVRGLPDEFLGDTIYNTVSMAPSVTVGARGSLGFEIFGKPIGQYKKENLNVGFGVYHNNFSGLGYSLGVDLGLSKVTKSALAPNISLGLDSNSGGNLGLGLNYDSKVNKMGVQGSYSSRAGLNNIGVYGHFNKSVQTNQTENEENSGKREIFGDHSISFVHPTFVPNGQQPMIHYNFAASVKLGGSIVGAFPNGTIYGYYNESKLKYNGKRIPNPAFGYLNFDQVRGESFLTDVMREKEGMVNKFSPNLPIPHLTFDLFQVQSAGISGTIRPYRNQIEVIEEAEYKSSSVGVSAGFDVGPNKSGVNVVPSLSENRTKHWGGGMDVLDPYLASKLVSSANIPKYSFYFTGDKRVRSKEDFEKIGGFDATAFRIAGNNQTSSILPLKTGYGGASNLPLGELDKNESPRAVVQFLNQELINGSTTLLDDFKVFYKDFNGNLVALDRSKFPRHHIAGFVILDEQGNRYTYGLPVYNLVHEEYSFTTNTGNGLFTSSGNNSVPSYSISGTKKHFKKTEIPPYAISYLLTSKIGRASCRERV